VPWTHYSVPIPREPRIAERRPRVIRRYSRSAMTVVACPELEGPDMSPLSIVTNTTIPSFLLVCDEWFPTKGGISQFNRALATALAGAGFSVSCLVNSVSPFESMDAQAHGVQLIAAERTVDGPQPYLRSPAVVAARPTVVIGHDLITGAVAGVHATRYLRDAIFVLICHTAHSQNERYKRSSEATRRIEESEQKILDLATEAHLVAAVGPRLTRRTNDLIDDGFGSKRVLRLDPGMDVPPDHAQRRRRKPENQHVVMLCRTEHIEPKGLDIAARAIAQVARPQVCPNADLLVRGAPANHCDSLREKLIEMSGLARHRVDVRPFTSNSDEVNRDLRRAALCVMPSRDEGFGLAALEAMAQGTPVLISDNSGLAEILNDLLGPAAERMIVEVADDASDVPRWSDAIQRVFHDLEQAFDHAHKIRRELAPILSWKATAQTLVSNLPRLGAATVRA
jgi:glycosyltransferase involved in cell wall biosynthesis